MGVLAGPDHWELASNDSNNSQTQADIKACSTGDQKQQEKIARGNKQSCQVPSNAHSNGDQV